MKTVLKILFAPLLWLVQACSPLGEPVNEEKSDNHYYNKKKSDIRYSPMGNWFELGNSPMNADVESFEVLSRFISKDKNRAYYMNNPIEEPSLNLEEFYVKEGDYMQDIAFDENNVYTFERVYDAKKPAKVNIVENANPKTYVRIDFDWSKDYRNHFYDHKLIDVDYSSFENINDKFSKDSSRVYNHYYKHFGPISADLQTFEVLDNHDFAMDSSHVFSMTYPSQAETKLVAIPKKFNEQVALLNDVFLTIGTRVFYRGTHLKNLNHQELQIIENSFYIKDKNHVYYKGELLQDADAATFGKLGKWEIGDQNGAYREGKRIEEKSEKQATHDPF